MEQLFWRQHPQSIAHPVCNLSEAEWIKYLIRHRQKHSSHYVASGDLITPDCRHIPAKVIFKYREYCPTGLVIDASEPKLIGAITDIYQQNDHPLRPFRPHIHYDPETKFGAQYCQTLASAGFDEAEPTIQVLIALLTDLHLPVSPLLPLIVAGYWPD